jgi:SPP1 gp7 family putative phage head morphogenesis protein
MAGVLNLLDGLENKYEKLVKDMILNEEYLKLLVYHIKTPTSKNFILGRDKLAKLFEAYMLETFVGGYKHGKDEVNKAKEFFKRKFNEPSIETTSIEGAVPEEAIAWYETYAIYLAGIYSEAILSKAEEIVLQAIEEGLHSKDIVIKLQNSEEFKGFTEHRLMTITRTEGTKAYNKGRLEQFKGVGDFVEAVQFSAVMDKRTTPICRRLNGMIMDIENKFVSVYLPPNHYNCRSIIVPVTRYEDWTEDDFSNVEKPIDGFNNPEWKPKNK